MDDRQAKWATLDQIQVAKTCPASWRDMQGDDRTRHCAQCGRNVYNLSHMSREEAAELIAEKEGRLCVRFYRRKDGTVMTGDCGKPERAVIKLKAALAPALALLGIAGCAVVTGDACDPAELVTTYRKEIRNLDNQIKTVTEPTVLRELQSKRQEALDHLEEAERDVVGSGRPLP